MRNKLTKFPTSSRSTGKENHHPATVRIAIANKTTSSVLLVIDLEGIASGVDKVLDVSHVVKALPFDAVFGVELDGVARVL